MAKNVVNTLGASNLSKKERSFLDYYGTDPKTIRALLDAESFEEDIWEPGSGHGNIVNELKAKGYKVWSTDIYDYGHQDAIIDFLEFDGDWRGSIVMNPPYQLAQEFVEKALSKLGPGHKLAALLRLQFLEGQKRFTELYKNNPPKKVYVFVNRQVCSKTDDFTEGSAVAYCWMIWEKGFSGSPTIHWLNAGKGQQDEH